MNTLLVIAREFPRYKHDIKTCETHVFNCYILKSLDVFYIQFKFFASAPQFSFILLSALFFMYSLFISFFLSDFSFNSS